MVHVNVLIIGGGVAGCAVAEALSRCWQNVFLVEQFPKLGVSTSTRNSGVIHSGIYYPTNCWKARHCFEGKVNHERDGMPVPEFAADVKQMAPEIEERDLQLGYTGGTPKNRSIYRQGYCQFCDCTRLRISSGHPTGWS
jgi:glycine/D-amino acid oxidase-like deaminating enzyme